MLGCSLLFKYVARPADSEIVGTQVSAPIRIVALVGLLAALAMGAWMMTAGRAGSDSEEPIQELRPVRKAEDVAAKLGSHNLSTAAGKPAATATAAPRAVEKPAAPVEPKPAVKAVRKTTAVAPLTPKVPTGTPTTIAGVLAKHSVVVVLLYDAESKVDAYSLSETALGAKKSGAGFLRVDVRNEKLATKFTKAYGVLQAPSLLVFKRPGTLALKLNGFADHETVEQAVLNVSHAPAAPAQ